MFSGIITIGSTILWSVDSGSGLVGWSLPGIRAGVVVLPVVRSMAGNILRWGPEGYGGLICGQRGW